MKSLPPTIRAVSLALYHKTRGGAILDKLAVGAVIRERVLRPGRWGYGWKDVCRVLRGPEHNRDEDPVDLAEWEACVHVARFTVEAMRDRDVAELFHTMGPFPTHAFKRSRWPPQIGPARELVPTLWASAFLFYRCVEGASPPRKGAR